jgi:pSer/pThr/pTyr-binding forkhead associated (FHA) protein
MSRVRYQNPDGIEIILSLDELGGQAIVGRSTDCGIYTNALSVSRNHAQVWAEPDGFYLADLGSSNGTSVNGRKLDKNERQILRSGDIIKCGEFTFVFEADDLESPSLGEIPLPPEEPNEAENQSQVWEQLQLKEEELTVLQQQFEEQSATLKDLQDSNEQQRLQLEKLQAQLSAQTSQLLSLEKERDILRQEQSKLQNQMRELQAEKQRHATLQSGIPPQELQLKQEIMTLKEELYRLRRSPQS